MKTYVINFRNKKTKEVLKSVEIDSETELGIILRGKIKADSEGFTFNKKKHNVSFTEK
jgi:hypothetical protein